MGISIHRAAERFVSTYDGVVSRHSFSFGAHYDPANVGFGQLVCHNDDSLQPLRGYDEHPHRDLEIVTIVLEGELRHTDSTGTSGVIVPGQAQRLSAGTGVVHTEHAGPGSTRFVQLWLRPDEAGLVPTYDQRDVEPGDGWTPLAGGEAEVTIASRGTEVIMGRIMSGSRVRLPEKPRVHLFVATGAVTLESGEPLREGDTARIVGVPGVELAGEAQVLVVTQDRSQ